MIGYIRCAFFFKVELMKLTRLQAILFILAEEPKMLVVKYVLYANN